MLSAKQSVPVNAKPTIPKVMLCCSMIFPAAVALGQTAVWSCLGSHDGVNGNFVCVVSSAIAAGTSLLHMREHDASQMHCDGHQWEIVSLCLQGSRAAHGTR